MNHRTERPPQLPRLTADQLRQQLAAEEAGVKPDCFLCGQPVLGQTFKPSYAAGADADDRTLINSPCGHAMTYGLGLAEQVKGQMRMEAATEATSPEDSPCPVGVMGAVASALEGHDVWIPEVARKAVAEAVMAAVEARLEFGPEDAWCKTCRRVWENRGHRCETPAEREAAAARQFAGEMRDFCSPHGVAADYADRLVEAMDRAKGEHRNTAADTLAAEWHRRNQRLEELTNSRGPEAQVAVVEHVRGELIGLRGALGVLLGGRVEDGTADLLGWSYYQEWRRGLNLEAGR